MMKNSQTCHESNSYSIISNNEQLQQAIQQKANQFELVLAGKKIQIISYGDFVLAKKPFSRKWEWFGGVYEYFLDDNDEKIALLQYLFGENEKKFDKAFEDLDKQFPTHTPQLHMPCITIDDTREEEVSICLMRFGKNNFIYYIWNTSADYQEIKSGNCDQIFQDLVSEFLIN
jgi:hypothetical protein